MSGEHDCDRPDYSNDAEYGPEGERRGKGLPPVITFISGAILAIGLGWSLFGTVNVAPAANLDALAEASATGSAEPSSAGYAAPEADPGMENIADTLENAIAAIEDAPAAVEEPAVAYVSCRVQGMAIEAWRCIYPAGDHDSGGYVKVAGADQVTRYGPNELAGLLSGSRARLSLPAGYSIEMQANGDEDYTLRLEIRRGGEVVYQDEASEYSTLSTSQGA